MEKVETHNIMGVPVSPPTVFLTQKTIHGVYRDRKEASGKKNPKSETNYEGFIA